MDAPFDVGVPTATVDCRRDGEAIWCGGLGDRLAVSAGGTGWEWEMGLPGGKVEVTGDL